MSKWCPKLSPALRASIGDDERQKETQHWEHHRDDLIHSVVATVSKIQIYDEVVPKFRFCRLSQETGLGLIGDIAHRDVADSCKSCSESHQVSRVFSVRIGHKSSVPWTSNGIFRKSRVSCNEWDLKPPRHAPRKQARDWCVPATFIREFPGWDRRLSRIENHWSSFSPWGERSSRMQDTQSNLHALNLFHKALIPASKSL